jgi:hypothetical protein
MIEFVLESKAYESNRSLLIHGLNKRQIFHVLVEILLHLNMINVSNCNQQVCRGTSLSAMGAPGPVLS